MRYKFLGPFLSLFMAEKGGAEPYNKGVFHLVDLVKPGLYRHAFFEFEGKNQRVYVDFSKTNKPDGTPEMRCDLHFPHAKDLMREMSYKNCELIVDTPLNREANLPQIAAEMAQDNRVDLVKMDSSRGRNIKEGFDRMFRSHGDE